MKLVSVLPLDKTVRAETLTYFSALEVAEGDLVAIPFRKKILHALVTSVQDARAEKASIKSSKIGLRKISRIIRHHPFPDALIVAARRTAEFYATDTGSVLSAVIPTGIYKSGMTQDPIRPRANNETLVIQTDDEDRYTQYRTLVREAFHRNESILILVPTIQDAQTTHAAISKGIETYALVLHSDISSRELSKELKKIQEENHPLLVISTPGFFAGMPPRTSILIIEQEHATAYKQMMRPFIDFRFFAEQFAREAKITLVRADALLSVETIQQLEAETYHELIPLKWRSASKASSKLVDMAAYKPNLRGHIRSISAELEALVAHTRSTSDHLFIFAGRKGLAPLTICGDCGTLLTCDRCKSPLILHKAGTNRKYICRRCGKEKDAHVRCTHCTSWKLVPLGIGTELIEEELQKLFPKLSLFRVDHQTVTRRKQVRELVHSFYETPGSVLVGTEFAIPYLDKPIGNVAVASIDELFSIPDFRIHERIIYRLLTLRSLAERIFLIQTRHKEHPLISAVLGGNISSFYQEELSMRKALSYPPFSVLIKLTVLKQKRADLDALIQAIAPYECELFPMSIVRKGKIFTSGIVKIPRKNWPDQRMQQILRAAPLSIEIAIDPDTLL